MSSALTGNKIKDSYQALLKIGTNGSLDPTTPVVISDGLGNDTPLQVSGNRFNTQYLASNIGLDLNFSGNAYTIGDYDFTSTTTSLKVDVNGQYIITNSNGGYRGLYLDFFNDSYQFGDINGVTNANLFVVDNATSVIKTMKSGSNIGLKLDYANNQYQFGDYDNINYSGRLIIYNGVSELNSEDNYLSLYGPSLNTWLGYYPGSINISNPAANSNNYGFGSDWYMNNNDSSNYPFKYNTVLNCYNNNLDTSDIAMFYNLIANVQDPGFNLLHFINFSNDLSVSNCFIFGLTDYIDSNLLEIFETKGIPTNVVVLNGTNLLYSNHTSNVFSVNASSVQIDGPNNSGINILGGDFAFKDNIFPAGHLLPMGERYGINIQGRYANAINNFTKVTSERVPSENTVQGQIQIEEKLLYRYYDNGSAFATLIDTLDDSRLYLQNSATYRVNAKIVSTTGDGDKSVNGNSTYDINWMVCTDSSGNVDFTSYCTGCCFDVNGATSFDLQSPNVNEIVLYVKPDGIDGNSCWVQAYITLQCITIN
jgi:hypothetical protein